MKRIDEIGSISKETVTDVIDDEIKDYKEPFPGGKEKLQNALNIMVLAHISSNLKKEAEDMLQKYIEIWLFHVKQNDSFIRNIGLNINVPRETK